ncbi:uncharacterized protein SCHCODRAFT_01161082 [Schizophyllum commune H4-8]|uniref:Uncharacterized protein n=1 Tax=Schizophyllum commune (strain H4-8 / FGSC 9210) TaxID=578458 RepID=D8QGS0_SCHCM|nr:uncharacterized protein SCHCODRAFT_01161082 [Schizophyllum commune H4-8]KAI5886856.1 hypothetical protein SCHCODRAFT_01161082 [Schizophyllum commune H4-8]
MAIPSGGLSFDVAEGVSTSRWVWYQQISMRKSLPVRVARFVFGRRCGVQIGVTGASNAWSRPTRWGIDGGALSVARTSPRRVSAVPSDEYSGAQARCTHLEHVLILLVRLRLMGCAASLSDPLRHRARNAGQRSTRGLIVRELMETSRRSGGIESEQRHREEA